MKTKEINEKFKKLDEQIKSLQEGQADLYEVTQFILENMKKYTDEPIFRTKLNEYWYRTSNFCKEYVLQYAYGNKVKEITTYADIQTVELYAYCDTHFILKNTHNQYFLVDMAKKTMTDIPIQLLCSKEMSLIVEGQTLKICPTDSKIAIGVCKND